MLVGKVSKRERESEEEKKKKSNEKTAQRFITVLIGHVPLGLGKEPKQKISAVGVYASKHMLLAIHFCA